MKNKNIESLEDVRSRMMAEQTVARMDARMRIKLSWQAKDGLVNALTRVANADGLLFGDQPFRAMPRRWSLAWILTRIVLGWQEFWRSRQQHRARPERYDDASAFSEAFYAVRRNGGIGLVVTLAIALLFGIIHFGEPAEIGLQVGRDALRKSTASGDIVVIVKDDLSGRIYGGMPWARRYDAQLVDTLREMGAKRIVYNAVMADPSNPVDDAKLAAAFDRAKGKVWLGALPSDTSTSIVYESVLPMAMFRERTQQAHFFVQLGMFRQPKYVHTNVMIGGKIYPSQSDILAGVQTSTIPVRPDYAIDYKSIPTIPAIKLMQRQIGRQAIAGKSIFIISPLELTNNILRIPGQGFVHIGYSSVLAAESIKRGQTKEMGFLIPLMLVAAFTLWSLTQPSLAKRMVLCFSALATILTLALGADQFGYIFLITPAIFALTLFAGRQLTRGNMAQAMATNPVSGLPGFAHLRKVKGSRSSAVVAIRVEGFAEAVTYQHPYAQKALVLAIAARINVIAPDSVVHHGENGTFAFLVGPDNECDIALVEEQLRALFTLDIVSLRELNDFTILTAVFNDLSVPVDTRLACALNALKKPVFAGLRLV